MNKKDMGGKGKKKGPGVFNTVRDNQKKKN